MLYHLLHQMHNQMLHQMLQHMLLHMLHHILHQMLHHMLHHKLQQMLHQMLHHLPYQLLHLISCKVVKKSKQTESPSRMKRFSLSKSCSRPFDVPSFIVLIQFQSHPRSADVSTTNRPDQTETPNHSPPRVSPP
jgi:hypothetical protein